MRSRIGLALCGVLLLSCATIDKDRRAVALQAATSGYQSALRWGYYEAAWGFLPPDRRRDPAPLQQLAGVRLTGYDVIQPPLAREDGTATQIVAIDYLREETQSVQRLTDRQQWRWDAAAGTWWLTSGLPEFR